MSGVIVKISKDDLVFKSLSRQWSLADKTLVMGILNVTPDSFSDGGEFLSTEVAVVRALEMVEEGADIIDVGGESSRPGAIAVSIEEEARRVVPIVEALSKNGITVSVDTVKSEVAVEAINAGAEIINDISAMENDGKMVDVVRNSGVGIVLMHKRGNSKTMQLDTDYDDIVEEVSSYLKDRLDFATSKGIEKEKVVIDIGIGFGKSVEGNLELIKNIDKFCDIGRPVLVGASRKSFMGTLLDLATDKRLNPSVAVATFSVMAGSSILRVHDVRETVEAVRMVEFIKNI